MPLTRFPFQRPADGPEHLAVLQAVGDNWSQRRRAIARGTLDGMGLERYAAGYLERFEQDLRRQLEKQLAADRVAGRIVIEHPTRWWALGDRRAYGLGTVDDVLKYEPNPNREVTLADMLAGRYRVVTDLFLGEASAIVIPPVRGAHRHG